MKGGTIQIAWHGSEPVLSLDFHNSSGLLATAGADHDIKLWSVHQKENATPTVKFEADLCYHSKAVNVLRFSPSGHLLASGGDGGEILIWKPVEGTDKQPSWKVSRTLQLHLRDVLDLAWSPDSSFLMSGSVDNQCMIWDVSTGKVQQIFNEHLHFVQGVAWDPAGEFLASISADRTCRIYSCQATVTSKKQKKGGLEEKKLYKCQQILAKIDVSSSKANVKTDSDGLVVKTSALKQHLFHDETLPSFFRRLAWSPDASFLVVPAGSHKTFLEAAPCNMSYVVSRKDMSRPAIHLPGPSKPVVAVRFCPVIFSLQPNTPEEEAGCAGFRLPYRLVFALATLDSLFIYDTQHSNPIVIFAGLHYAAITDIAWSADAHYVAVSSQDGYCTLLAFSDDELGVRLPCSEVPSHIASYLPETLLARCKVVLNETSSEPKSNPAVQASPVSRCPRPLKHRRITPTTLPAVSSPSPQEREQPTDSPSSSQIHKHIPVGPANSLSSPENRLHRRLSAAADSSPTSSLNNRHATPTANPVDSPSESHLVTPLTTQGDSSANGSKRCLNISTSENTPSSSESCLQGITVAAPAKSPVSAQQHDQVIPVSISGRVIAGSEKQSSIASTTISTDPSLSTENCQPRTPPVIPASSPLRPRKQRRIVPIAIPAESPSSPPKYASPATAANPADQPSSLGESNSELTVPSSCRRRSGLEFRIELNMEAE